VYLHIGKNNILLFKNIIGIFDLETIRNSEENKKLMQKINTIDDSKTLIITNKNKITTEVISNISLQTLQKRILKGEYDEPEFEE
jgi:uncharacterized protein YdbL (DUF1318 family)